MLFEKQFFAFGHGIFDFRDGAPLVDFSRNSGAWSALRGWSGLGLTRGSAGAFLGEQSGRKER